MESADDFRAVPAITGEGPAGAPAMLPDPTGDVPVPADPVTGAGEDGPAVPEDGGGETAAAPAALVVVPADESGPVDAATA